ncbi:peptide ABC transporter permease [Chimaeribacter californicus]|uniref:Peptide ABC transporter permease n=1 Tax=Chimaeribacter californicus TaxID=2060067 RepID=A0A2N5DV20_9GAMM|nr:ABC transporter permease [Chimaeribacter californicus]PLR30815.1 peptide ABC transporter permease [Chimaeribacter californicus]
MNTPLTLSRRRAGSPALLAALTFLAVLLLAVFFPALLSPYDPLAADPLNAQLPPSAAHWLGTDQLGRDVLTRVIYGSRYSLLISLAAMAVAVVAGTLLGLLAGLVRGGLDELISRAVDVISAFPDLLLALMLIAFTGPGTTNLIFALGVASVPRFARVVRAQTLVVASSGYVEQARTFGLAPRVLVWRHILPHAIAHVPVLATLGLGSAIIGTAGLSFLGMGPQPPTAEWGLMLAEGRNYLRNAWWIGVWPGVALTLTVLAVTTVGRHWQAHFEGKHP